VVERNGLENGVPIILAPRLVGLACCFSTYSYLALGGSQVHAPTLAVHVSIFHDYDTLSMSTYCTFILDVFPYLSYERVSCLYYQNVGQNCDEFSQDIWSTTCLFRRLHLSHLGNKKVGGRLYVGLRAIHCSRAVTNLNLNGGEWSVRSACV